MLLPIQRLRIQFGLKENRRNEECRKDHQWQRQEKRPSPRIDPRGLVVITDGTMDGEEPFSGHHRRCVDRVIQKGVLHWVDEVGEEGVGAVRV